MFSTELSPEIWLSMNSDFVCTFAFGKPFSAASSRAWLAAVSPPAMRRNE